jgi:hypothetical protein
VEIAEVTAWVEASDMQRVNADKSFDLERAQWTNAISQQQRLFETTLGQLPVGIVVWLVHWNVLRREANAFGESREGATVRRIYFYLMAATGLALLWVGAVELLHALIDTWLDAGAVGGIWHEPLANGLALIAVGAPIWALHWRSVQPSVTP